MPNITCIPLQNKLTTRRFYYEKGIDKYYWRMLGILNNEQLAKLHEVLECSFTMFAENYEETQHSNDELLKLFLSAKQVEGCSERSLKYYKTTLSKMNEKINKSVRQVETNDIRTYISNYENESNAGKITLDNIRRIISSFFAWLEDENYIIKSPARRIHKIRVGKLHSTKECQIVEIQKKIKRHLGLYERDMQELKEFDYRILNHGMITTL